MTMSLNHETRCTPLPLLACPATVHDIDQIAQILEERSPATIPLSREEILNKIHCFRVITQGSEVMATFALFYLGDGYFELRSVAVAPKWEGLGLGRCLLTAAKCEARTFGLNLICVTQNRDFFCRFGFETVPLSSVPPKKERLKCPSPEKRFAMCWQSKHSDRWLRNWRRYHDEYQIGA